MHLRLRNQNNPNKTLTISRTAWFMVLNLAETYGWNPMGTAKPDQWVGGEPQIDGYDPCLQAEANFIHPAFDQVDAIRLVMIEDALNLAEALDRAFIEYDPEWTPNVAEITMAGRVRPVGAPGPSLGVIMALKDFCWLGAYWLEGEC